MDVDNQNEEKVETEKEKQDKADKIENVQEKQDADTVEKVQEIKDQHNDLTEDEFWNTQSDSQIDKLLSQAETDIINRKIQRESPLATDVLNKKPTILRPICGTNKNEIDCGLFSMMHMENYNGETAWNWKLVFPKEDEGNTHDIIRMRVRFAA
ncbi:hypothetical protein Tco_0733558 [Tanacetum coccineum]